MPNVSAVQTLVIMALITGIVWIKGQSDGYRDQLQHYTTMRNEGQLIYKPTIEVEIKSVDGEIVQWQTFTAHKGTNKLEIVAHCAIGEQQWYAKLY